MAENDNRDPSRGAADQKADKDFPADSFHLAHSGHGSGMIVLSFGARKIGEVNQSA